MKKRCIYGTVIRRLWYDGTHCVQASTPGPLGLPLTASTDSDHRQQIVARREQRGGNRKVKQGARTVLPGIAVVAGRARTNPNRLRLGGGQNRRPVLFYRAAAVGMVGAQLWHALLFYIPPLSTLRIVRPTGYTGILTSNRLCELIYKLVMFWKVIWLHS